MKTGMVYREIRVLFGLRGIFHFGQFELRNRRGGQEAPGDAERVAEQAPEGDFQGPGQVLTGAEAKFSAKFYSASTEGPPKLLAFTFLGSSEHPPQFFCLVFVIHIKQEPRDNTTVFQFLALQQSQTKLYKMYLRAVHCYISAYVVFDFCFCLFVVRRADSCKWE